jgi:hypothetical protein
MRDDVRSPLKDELGWVRYTTFPNFGKVEYFYEEGLTGVAGVLPDGRDNLIPRRSGIFRATTVDNHAGNPTLFRPDANK